MLVFSNEYFRIQFLRTQITIKNVYDTGLWTFSELKYNLMTSIVLKEKIDYGVYYFFIYCIVCSERIKIMQSHEEILKIRVLRMKAKDFKKFYSESEDILKRGKTIYKELEKQFQTAGYLEKLLPALEPLKNYKTKS